MVKADAIKLSRRNHIAVVEDHASLNSLIQRMLVAEGYICEGFGSGSELLRWLKSGSSPETLVLLDYYLPDCNGRELVQNFFESGLNVPFIIFTGRGDERVAVEMMKKGALDYLVKDGSFLNLVLPVVKHAIERLKTEDMLKESQYALKLREKKYRSIFENIQDVYFEIDQDGTTIEVSPSLESIFQYSREYMIGRKLFMDPENVTKIVDKLNLTGQVSDMEMLLTRKDEKKLYCSISCKFSKDENGAKPTIIGMVRNIHERREAELSLKNQEENFRILAEHTSIFITRHKWDGTYLYASPACKAIIGIRPEELMGKSIYQFVFNGDLDALRQIHSQIIEQTGNNLVATYRMQKSDGSLIWIESSWHSVQNVQSGVVEELICVSKDVTQALHAKQLEKEMEIERKANKTKSEFLANISHEIRNPLSAIIGMAKTLQKTRLNKAQQSFTTSLVAASENLLHILNEILDFSKIESGKIDLTYSEFSIREVLSEVVELYRYQAENKGVNLIFEVNNTVPKLFFFDKQKLSQIIGNLLSNAIKFTNQGMVKLSVNLVKDVQFGKNIEFVLNDTGVGVAQEQIPMIFEPFRQADNSRSKEFQGSGLGLSIVKKLVSALQGTLQFESVVGEGSRVTIIFPFVGSPDLKGDNIKKAVGRKAHEKALPLKVLIAEDDAINQMYLAGFLRAQGWKVEVASNGLIAMEKYMESRFDLILMDGQMPKMDGFEATRRIREMEKSTGTRTPILAITGYAIPGERDRFINAGMDDYITKPINEAKLLEIIHEWV